MTDEPVRTVTRQGRVIFYGTLSLLFSVMGVVGPGPAAQDKLVAPGTASLVPGERAVTTAASATVVPGLMGLSSSYPVMSGVHIGPDLYSNALPTVAGLPLGANESEEKPPTASSEAERRGDLPQVGSQSPATGEKGTGQKIVDFINRMNPARLLDRDKAVPAKPSPRPQDGMPHTATAADADEVVSGDASVELKKHGIRAIDAVIDTGIDELERNLEGHEFLRNVEITYHPAINGNNKLLQADVMISLIDEGDSNTFGQFGWQEYDKEQGFNVGLGYRHLLSDELLLGVNAFYDYLDHPRVSRYSVGIEAKGSWFDVSGNWYQGLREGTRRDGQEVASLDGYDVELAGRIPLAPWLEYSGRYYQWDAAHPSQEDASGVEVGVRFQPVPLIGVEANYDIPEDDDDGMWRMEANWKYRFGVPISEQLSLQRVQAEKPVHRRFERVRREYRHRIGNSAAPPAVALALCDSGGAAEVGPGQTFRTSCSLGMVRGNPTDPPVRQVATLRVSSAALQRRIDVVSCRVTPGSCTPSVDPTAGVGFTLNVPRGQELRLALAIMLTAMAPSGVEPLVGGEEVRLVINAGGALDPLSRLLFRVNTTDVLPHVTLMPASELAPEGGEGTFRIMLNPVALAPLTIAYRLSGVEAADLVNRQLTGSVTVPAMTEMMDFRVNILGNDGQSERDEILIATLEAGTGYILQNPFSAQLTIPANNVALPTVSLGPASSSVMEGMQTALSMTVGPILPTGNLTVFFTVTPHGASGASLSDYGLTDANGRSLTPIETQGDRRTYSVTLSSAGAATIQVDALSDALTENDEQLRVALAADRNNTYQVGSIYQSTVTITDRFPAVSLAAASLEVREGTSGRVAFIRNGFSFQTVTAEATLHLGNGVMSTDYSLMNGTPGCQLNVSSTGLSLTMSIPATLSLCEMNIEALEDTDNVELREIITLNLEPGNTYTIGTPDATTITLVPVDDVRPSPVRNLSATPGQNQAVLSWVDPRDLDVQQISITYAPVVEGATQPEVIAPGVQTVTIAGLAAGTEYTFNVFAVDGAGNQSTTETVRATTPNTVAFQSATANAAEGTATVSVSVTLGASPAADVAIPVVTGGGTATAGSDYTAITQDVTFTPTGVLTQTVNISITDDSVDDDDETFMVSFGTLPAGITAGTPSSVTVTITDND